MNVFEYVDCIQVLPIWEGTSSVQCLDMVRALRKTRGEAMIAVQHRVEDNLDKASTVPALDKARLSITQAMADLTMVLHTQQENLELLARDLCLSLAHTYIAALLLEHALATQSPVDLVVVDTWCRRKLCTVASQELESYSKEAMFRDKELVYQLYNKEYTFPAQSIQ